MSVKTAYMTSEQLRAEKTFGVRINFSRKWCVQVISSVWVVTGFNAYLPMHEKGNKKEMGGLRRSPWVTERQHRTDRGREWRRHNCSSGISGRFSAQTWRACQMMSGREKQKESVQSLETWKFTPLTYLAWIGVLPLCSRSKTALSHMSETDDETKQG